MEAGYVLTLAMYSRSSAQVVLIESCRLVSIVCVGCMFVVVVEMVNGIVTLLNR